MGWISLFKQGKYRKVKQGNMCGVRACIHECKLVSMCELAIREDLNAQSACTKVLTGHEVADRPMPISS